VTTHVAPPRCVVFDIDDTLYLERDYVRSGFRAVDAWVTRELGLMGFADAAWAYFLAGRRGDVFDQVLRDEGVEPSGETVRAMVECYRSHRPAIELLDDAAALIEGLTGRVRFAAISDGPLESQQAKVAALGVSSWAAAIVLTAELGSEFGKPHPRAFEVVESILGTHGNDNVYVADNPGKDFVAPRELGWRTVRVRRPESLHVETACDDDVDFEVVDLSRVAPMLGFEPEPAP
jgi:putative hydrolase of the HAD superfamily